jgi:hypothetical protein
LTLPIPKISIRGTGLIWLKVAGQWEKASPDIATTLYWETF